ncbi:hypothetical protein C8R43DRAFT_1122999 [Mycena crocata]|nr:hypothetical protein C8R43DRAFT_1122999 [Mycena crocata]
MASSGSGYTQDEFQQFLKFQAMMAASKQQSDSPSQPSTPPPNTSNQASSPSKKDESKSQGKKKAAGEDSPSPKKSKTDRKSKSDKDDDEDEKVLKIEDYMNVETLPDVCEVWDESVQEPSMTEEYKKLPNCEKAVIVSWDPQPGEGNVPLSCWPELSDQYDEDVFYNILSFTQQGRYVNLTRVDPQKCRAAKTNMGPNHHKWILEIEERTAICVSLIALIESCLSEAGTLHNSGKGLVSEFVTGHLHSYEAERTIGVLGMVFRLKEMYGQISKDAFTFSTKPIPKDSNSSPSKTSGKRKFKGVASGATAASSSATWGSNEALSFDADIPVYDARGSTFNINEHIEDLNTHLPRYSGSEIPEMTLSAVGYTVNQYMDKDSRQTVTFNLQFIIVLGESNLESSED